MKPGLVLSSTVEDCDGLNYDPKDYLVCCGSSQEVILCLPV